MNMKKESMTWTKDKGLTTFQGKDKLKPQQYITTHSIEEQNEKEMPSFGEVVGQLESSVMVGENTGTSPSGRSLNDLMKQNI